MYRAATGTPVHAAQRGRVVRGRGIASRGNTVVVDHGLGLHLYGHPLEDRCEGGDALEAGAVLGKIGATGRVTGATLPLGLTVKSAVNPLQLEHYGKLYRGKRQAKVSSPSPEKN